MRYETLSFGFGYRGRTGGLRGGNNRSGFGSLNGESQCGSAGNIQPCVDNTQWSFLSAPSPLCSYFSSFMDFKAGSSSEILIAMGVG